MEAEGIQFKTIYLKKNRGHAIARRKSLAECKNELVALMDADDISLPDRFRVQLQRFMEKPSPCIVGGQITEFDGEPSNITGTRKVPLTDANIKEYMKKHCPMNQMSVMFRRADVEKVGGYRDWYCNEDYYLWARMALAGCPFANVPDVLVNVRTGEQMSSRRGGVKYFQSERKLQEYFLKKRIISYPRFLYNVLVRFVGEVVMTNSARNKLFRLYRRLPVAGSRQVPQKQNAVKKRIIKPAEYPPFSVAMCVYHGDKAEWFDMALESVINQTVKPAEIVLVVDGPIPSDIQDVIEKYRGICGGVERYV